jgi:hypothetical protein
MNATEQGISKRLESRDDSASGGVSRKENKSGQGLPLYVLETIVQYFWNKFYLPIIEIDIGLSDERTRIFRVYRQDNETETVRGIDEMFVNKAKDFRI